MKSKSANNDTCSTGVAMTTESEPTRCDGSCCSSAAVMSGSFLLLLFLLHQTFDSLCFSLGYRADSESDVKRTETKSGGDALGLLYTSAVQHNNVSGVSSGTWSHRANFCSSSDVLQRRQQRAVPSTPTLKLSVYSCYGLCLHNTCTMMSHGLIQSADLW